MPARDLRVDIATDRSAGGYRNHDPVGYASQTAKLERRMECDYHRRKKPHQNVEIEPMAGIADRGQPRPSLSERVQKDQHEQEGPEDTKRQSDPPARTKHLMHGVVRPVRKGCQIVMETNDHEGR